MGPFKGLLKLLQYSDHHQILHIVSLNQNMQHRQNLMCSEQEKGPKPHFGPFLALIGPFQGQQNHFQHFHQYQVLDIVSIDYNMQYRQKLMHFEQANGRKPHFSPFLALNGPFQGQQNFFQHFYQYQVLDIVIIDHNTQNRQKLMHFEQENGLKPHFGPFLALNGPFLGQHIFLTKIRKRHFSRLTSG